MTLHDSVEDLITNSVREKDDAQVPILREQVEVEISIIYDLSSFGRLVWFCCNSISFLTISRLSS